MLELDDDRWCFACGEDNPIGLKTRWEKCGDEYVAKFTPKREHQGYIGITHGGIVATLLDEAMARLVWAEGHSAVTAEMTVRLKHPARVGQELRIAGKIVSEDRRTINCSAEAKNPEGQVIATATGKMIKVKEKG